MIKLKELHLKNFLSYRELHFDFLDKGLTLISGDNGAGKSTIPSAVAWVLFGRTQKGLQGDEVVNWVAKKDCVVSISFLIDNVPCEVARHRKSSVLDNPNHLRLRIGDGEIEGTVTEKQKVLTEALGSEFQTFINTTFFSQGKVKFIGEVTDTDRKALFKSILDLKSFDVAYNRTTERIVLLESELRDVENKKLELANDIRLIEQEHNHILEMSNQFEATREAQLTEHRHKIEELERKKEKRYNSPALEDELKSLVETTKRDIPAIRTATDIKLSRISSEEKLCEVAILNAETDLDYILNKGICPTCKRPFDNEEIVAEKKELIKSLKSKMGKIRKAHSEVIAEGIMLRKEEEEYHKSLRRIEAITTEVQQIKNFLEDTDVVIDEVRDRAQELTKQENPYPNMLETVKLRLKVETHNVDKLLDKIKQYEEGIELLGEVKEIYSKRGVVSFIMENYFRFLSAKANYYLSMLNSDISINISAQKKTKKGDLREEITIEIQKGSRKAIYENLSDGERQRTNLVLLLSVYCLCRSLGSSSFDTLFLDEILDLSLDSDGKAFVIDLLTTVSKDENVPHILVISHSPEIKEKFLDVIHVKNIDGTSIIE